MQEFRNQYFVCVKPSFAIPDNFGVFELAQYSILAELHLDIQIAEKKDTSVALIGFAIDPEKPEADNREIVTRLANSPSRAAFEDRVSGLSGRFAVLYAGPAGQMALTDSCGLRQLLYHFEPDGMPQVTSSLPLFLTLNRFDLSCDPELERLMASSVVKKEEMALYGDYTFDSRLKRLLPNHRLDLATQKVSRLPLRLPASANDDELLNLISAQLRGTYKALCLRHQKLLQGLTAGWDSRLLCAASRPCAKRIKYFVFSGTGRPDEEIPQSLSHHLDLSFEIFHAGPLRSEFLENFRKINPFSRVLKKTEHIQYHFDHHKSNRHLLINGNCGEISRNYYGSCRSNISLKNLILMANYRKHYKFFSKVLSKWYSQAQRTSRESGISICDLFYWEQRMGTWGAKYPEEQDLAVEEFSPLNNRLMTLRFLAVRPEQRSFPDYTFHQRLIRALWTETLDAPINPEEDGILPRIKAKYKNKALVMWLRSFLP